MAIVTDIAAFAELVSLDHGLCVVSTLRRDGSIQASVVNAGVMPHPLTGVQVVALVAVGGARKLHHLRADPRATIVARAGWHWAAVEGTAEILGPDDPHPAVDSECLRVLLRDIFRPPAEPTTTGTPMTESWPRNDEPPSSSPHLAPTPTPGLAMPPVHAGRLGGDRAILSGDLVVQPARLAAPG